MPEKLCDLLQIWGFDENNIIFSDGSLGFGLDVGPTDISCWDVDRINDLKEASIQFLNALPPDTDIQFIQEITSGNKSIIETNVAPSKTSKDSLVQTLGEQRSEKLISLETQGLLPLHSLKVFVRSSSHKDLIEKPKFFSKANRFEPIAEEKLRSELQKLNRLKDDTKNGLRLMGLKTSELSVDQVMDLLYSQWNPFRSLDRNTKAFDPEDVRESINLTHVSVSQNGFTIGDVHHKVISLKILPDYTFSGLASILRDLPFESRLMVTVHSPHQHKEIETLQTQRRLAFSMVHGKQNGVSDLDSEAKFDDLETLLSQMISQGEKVFHVSMNVILRSKDKEDLEDQVAHTLSSIRELSGAEGLEESLVSFDIFSSIAIPNSRCPERIKKIKSSNLSDLIPIYGPWKGHQDPKILLRSRQGSLISFDPFSSELTNYNQIVSGGSGSGKSFLTNVLLMQMLKYQPKIFIIDIGGSYKKMSELLSGQYVPLGVESDVSINPFDLAPGETDPSNHKIKFLVGLVEMMTKEDSERGLRRLQRTQIEEVIQSLYEKKANPLLSDLRSNLLEHEDVELRKIGKILGAWTGNSPYGHFVDRPTKVALDRDTVCFDLKGLDSYPDLQSVCLLLVTDLIWREVQKDRSQMKFIIFDECWKLLDNEAGATFIGEVFRTLRKYYGSAIAISQTMDDFAESKVASAILPNSSIKWILKQKGADKRRLQEILELNESELGLVSSLTQEKGIFSQAFLISEDQRSVVSIESTPLEYWLATTNPPDLKEIESLTKENPKLTQLEILNELSSKHPNGARNPEI